MYSLNANAAHIQECKSHWGEWKNENWRDWDSLWRKNIWIRKTLVKYLLFERWLWLQCRGENGLDEFSTEVKIDNKLWGCWLVAVRMERRGIWGDSKGSVNNHWMWPLRKKSHWRYFLGWPTCLLEMACIEIGPKENRIYLWRFDGGTQFILRFTLSVNHASRDVQERDRGMKIWIILLLF